MRKLLVLGFVGLVAQLVDGSIGMDEDAVATLRHVRDGSHSNMDPHAADAADDAPRASMIAAPRLPTCGMNAFAFQSASLILSLSDAPPTVANR